MKFNILFAILCAFFTSSFSFTARADIPFYNFESKTTFILFVENNVAYRAECPPLKVIHQRSECKLTTKTRIFSLDRTSQYFLMGLPKVIKTPIALSPLNIGAVTALLAGPKFSPPDYSAMRIALIQKQKDTQDTLNHFGDNPVLKKELQDSQAQLRDVDLRLKTSVSFAQANQDFALLEQDFIRVLSDSRQWVEVVSDKQKNTIFTSLALVMVSGIGSDFDFVPIHSANRTFMMGSPLSELGHNWYGERLRQVTFTHDFELQTTPVTQAQWVKYMGYNPSTNHQVTACPDTYAADLDYCPQNPVETVTWLETQKFIEILNRRAGERCTYRLPTAAEYEFSLRGNTTGSVYYGTDVEQGKNFAWLEDNSGGHTHEVAQMPENPFHLFDMIGNVYQWTSDWYNDSGEAETDPTGPSSMQPGAGGKTLRGCSYRNSVYDTRTAASGFDNKPNKMYGFRLARTCPATN